MENQEFNFDGMSLEEMKKMVIKALLRNEWQEENKTLSEKKTPVYTKKEPTAIALRLFKNDEDYETQVMNECQAFYQKHGTYPNAIVMNPKTFDRWYSVAEESALETAATEILQQGTFAEIEPSFAIDEGPICELGSIQAVYKWLGGKSVPTIDNLGILSNLLNTPIDDLVVFKTR